LTLDRGRQRQKENGKEQNRRAEVEAGLRPAEGTAYGRRSFFGNCSNFLATK
jgi:hypothetical protein